MINIETTKCEFRNDDRAARTSATHERRSTANWESRWRTERTTPGGQPPAGGGGGKEEERRSCGLLISTTQPPAGLNLRIPLPAGAVGDDPLESRADENNSSGTWRSYFRNGIRSHGSKRSSRSASDDVSENTGFEIPEIYVWKNGFHNAF